MKSVDLLKAVQDLAKDAARIQDQIEADLEKGKKKSELIGQVEYLQKQLTWVSAFLDQSLLAVDPLQMLTLKDVCKKLNVGYNTLVPWVTIGALKAARSGKTYLVSRSNLAEFERMITGLDLSSENDLYQVEQALKKTA